MRMTRFTIVASLLILSSGCNNETPKTDQNKEAGQPAGILQTFEDSPGLVRSEIVDAAGRLATIGYWLNGKKEGSWTDYTQDERVYRLTTYIQGKKEGLYLEFDTRNQVSHRYFYHNDELEGKYLVYENTYLKEVKFYVKGKQEGVSRVYYGTSKLMEEGYFKDGLRDGISKWYDRDGNLTLKYEYKKGELIKK